MSAVDILSLARPNVIHLSPYSSARDEFEGGASVYLDANENPFSNGYNRYPDPLQKELKSAISKIKKIQPNQIFLGNGSDEAIDLLFRVFCEPGHDEVIIPQPTYGMYSVSAAINNVNVISVSLSSSFDLEVEEILKRASSKSKILFLCSPNNPSGNLLNQKQIETVLAGFPGIVVIDEAYIDFTGTSGWSSRIEEYNNLAILQTLSKAWGLAGLRLGMCFANQTIIELINKIKPPYNINISTQKEALKALQTHEAVKNQHVISIVSERNKLTLDLQSIPRVRNVYPSDANFLLVKIDNAGEVYSKLVSKGIVVRDRSKVILCEECLRITVGTKEENEILIKALKAL